MSSTATPNFYDPTWPDGIPWPRKESPLYRTVLPKHLRALTHARNVTVRLMCWSEGRQQVRSA